METVNLCWCLCVSFLLSVSFSFFPLSHHHHLSLSWHLTYLHMLLRYMSVICCLYPSVSPPPPPFLAHPSWYHGSVSRQQAEAQLQRCREASFLVRDSESGTSKYSIALKWVWRCVYLNVCWTRYRHAILCSIYIFIHSIIFYPLLPHHNLNFSPAELQQWQWHIVLEKQICFSDFNILFYNATRVFQPCLKIGMHGTFILCYKVYLKLYKIYLGLGAHWLCLQQWLTLSLAVTGITVATSKTLMHECVSFVL